MHYFFTKDDFEALNREIAQICDRIKAAAKEMGDSCKEGAETFHDNFAYEEGERQQYMWSKRLRDMIKIRNQAQVVGSQSVSDRVSLGRTVTVRCLETGKERTFTIGSYMIFAEASPGATQIISYSSPLARLVMSAKVGDIREGILGGTHHSYVVVKIT